MPIHLSSWPGVEPEFQRTACIDSHVAGDIVDDWRKVTCKGCKRTRRFRALQHGGGVEGALIAISKTKHGAAAVALYRAIPEGEAAMLNALGVSSRSARAFDRAMRTLTAWNLAAYNRDRWVQTPETAS